MLANIPLQTRRTAISTFLTYVKALAMRLSMTSTSDRSAHVDWSGGRRRNAAGRHPVLFSVSELMICQDLGRNTFHRKLLVSKHPVYQRVEWCDPGLDICINASSA